MYDLEDNFTGWGSCEAKLHPQDEPRHPGGVEESVDETWVHTWSRGFVMAEGLSRDNSIMVMVAIGVFWSMTGILLSGDIYSNV